jgi:predicted transcriptional regulator
VGMSIGVKLEDRYVGASLFRGKASIEKILEIYEKQHEYFRLTVLEGRRFEEVRPPRILIEEVHWRKWKNELSGGYSVKFSEYDLEIETDPKEEEIISQLVKCARRHGIRIKMNLRQE